jgi:hypothetical protein
VTVFVLIRLAADQEDGNGVARRYRTNSGENADRPRAAWIAG